MFFLQCRRFNIYKLPRYVTIIVILHGLVKLMCYLYWFFDIFFSIIWILKGVDKLASFVSHDFNGNFTLLGISLTFTLIVVNCGFYVQTVEMKFRTRNIFKGDIFLNKVGVIDIACKCPTPFNVLYIWG